MSFFLDFAKTGVQHTVWTAQAIIDAHISILCSISLLVSILGAGPEMFKNLANQIYLNQNQKYLNKKSEIFEEEKIRYI